MIGYEMIEKLEYLHSKNFIYRDFKPENIMIGKEDNFRELILIDFGLAKLYKTLDLKHIPEKEKLGFIGTLRYASINSHLWKELSRRDDLESLGYVLIYLVKGTLPWMNLNSELEREAKKEYVFKIK